MSQAPVAANDVFLPLVAKNAATTHQIFLPLVAKNYVVPAPLWRFGVARARRWFTDYDSYGMASMRFGWYVDFNATADPPTPYGMEYVQTVRIKQWKRAADGSATECCVGCSYWTPANYTVSPSVSQIQSIASSHPGMTWLIGNEMERIDWGTGYCARQDEMLPELYALVYHDLYYAIKNADPTAQVAIGGVVEATPLRLQYLSRVWDAYSSTYGSSMPVDVWNIHVYVLREEKGGWGADIPAGLAETTGMLYGFSDHKDFAKAWAQVVAMRQWMKERGQQNKPLINTEYGVLLPDWFQCTTYPNTSGCPFGPEQIRDSYMYPCFNYFLNQTDASIGYPADGNRLMQRWNWYSVDYDDGVCDGGVFYKQYNAPLFDSGLGPSYPPTNCTWPAQGISALGTYWKQYVQSLPAGATKPYVPAKSPEQIQKPVMPATPSSQAGVTDCPENQRVRVQHYAPAPTGLSMDGLSSRVSITRMPASRMTHESTICLPSPSK
jgi:hypothetical protein